MVWGVGWGGVYFELCFDPKGQCGVSSVLNHIPCEVLKSVFYFSETNFKCDSLSSSENTFQEVLYLLNNTGLMFS